jgi:hypothetical protein
VLARKLHDLVSRFELLDANTTLLLFHTLVGALQPRQLFYRLRLSAELYATEISAQAFSHRLSHLLLLQVQAAKHVEYGLPITKTSEEILEVDGLLAWLTKISK